MSDLQMTALSAMRFEEPDLALVDRSEEALPAVREYGNAYFAQ